MLDSLHIAAFAAYYWDVGRSNQHCIRIESKVEVYAHLCNTTDELLRVRSRGGGDDVSHVLQEERVDKS